MLKAIPMSQREAAAWIRERHRHLPKTNGDMWRVACTDGGGKIVGVITVGRPLARSYDYRKVCQVLRCCTDGTENACSFLYGRASRIAKEMGYEQIITYTLMDEPGTSLKASGWMFEGITRGKSWDTKSRKRDTPNLGPKKRWVKNLI